MPRPYRSSVPTSRYSRRLTLLLIFSVLLFCVCILAILPAHFRQELPLGQIDAPPNTSDSGEDSDDSSLNSDTLPSPQTTPPSDESSFEETNPPRVDPILVTLVAIGNAKDLTVGETLTLSAAVLPENADNKSVAWSIAEGDAYASISEDGTLTAIAPGSVTIKLEALDGSGESDTVTVQVNPIKVFSVTISGAKDLIVGQTLTLTAAVLPDNAADKRISWSITSGSDYAAISENGVLTAIAPGSVTVRAKAKDGSDESDTVTIQINPIPVSSVTISGAMDLIVGETLLLSAAVLPEDAGNKKVTWSITSGSDFATISKSGVLTATAAGLVTVKATAKDGSGCSDSITLQIYPVKVSSVTISGAKDIAVGEKLTLSAVILPSNADNKEVAWSITSGSDYATITQNGVLTATAVGTVTVKARAKDGSGKSASATIEITPVKVSSITISGAKDITVGQTLTLSAAVLPENAANKSVSWSITSGSDYATITKSGVLTAIAPGSVTVRAKAQDGSGKSASVTITVNPIKVSSITISGAKNLTVGKTLMLSATVLPQNASNKNITWSITSGGDCATITQSGVLTATAPGSVTVKAKAKDGSGKSASVTIQIADPLDVAPPYVDLIDPEEFADVLAQSTPLADDSYLEQFLFLGDSITNGMKKYGFLPGGQNNKQVLFPSYGTITLYQVKDVVIWDPELKKDITVLEAIEWRQPKLLLIALGVNGIGWETEESFCREYRDMLDAILAVSPNTTIVLQSMLPVAKHYGYPEELNNRKIANGNLWIARIAREYGLKFLNIAPTLLGEDGYLDQEYVGTDGLHLEPAGYYPIIDFYKRHRIPGF